jgi:glycosylphosphatidylinositol transamidase
MLTTVFFVFAATNSVLPFILSSALTHFFAPTTQQYQLIKSFSLLLLGLFLSSLATLNFSLSFLIGLLATPLTYIYPLPSTSVLRLVLKTAVAILLTVIAPTAVLVIGCWSWGWSVEEVLAQAAYGWDVFGMNTQVVVWCVWWPAWIVGGILLFGKPREESVQKVEKVESHQRKTKAIK